MLTADNICVHYSYKKVLSGVSLSFEKGKIYALLGENGAGKSTLAHVICGDLKPDSGSLYLDGKEVSFSNPHQALQVGIACLHQRPLLAEQISVMENLLLGAETISRKTCEEELKKWLPAINKKTPIYKLSPEEKFFVSLCGILLKEPEVLILDEPSALLSPDQSTFLFSRIKEFAKKGMTIILITHFFAEALKEADEVVLLKNGLVEAKGKTSDFTEDDLTKILFDTETQTEEEKLPSVTNLERIPEAVEEEKLIGMSDEKIRKLRKENFAIIPSDRCYTASNPKLTILQLVTSYKTSLNKKDLLAYGEKITKKAEVNIRLDEKASCLSGGMLQRLILERELDNNPETIILCSPYQGLDTAACNKLTCRIKKELSNGKKILISGECK